MFPHPSFYSNTSFLRWQTNFVLWNLKEETFFDTFLVLWFQNSRPKLIFNINILKDFPKISRKSTMTWMRLGLLLYGKITPEMKVCVNNFAEWYPFFMGDYLHNICLSLNKSRF